MRKPNCGESCREYYRARIPEVTESGINVFHHEQLSEISVSVGLFMFAFY